MARPKKTYPLFPDCDVRGVGLNELADLAGMPRTNTYRAIKARAYAVHKVDGFKKPYSTHANSALRCFGGVGSTRRGRAQHEPEAMPPAGRGIYEVQR